MTVRDTKTAFGTLDCPPLGETLLTITITFYFIICMVYKDISVQPCDLFLTTVVFLLSPLDPFYNYTTFLHYIIVSLWQSKSPSSFVPSSMMSSDD